MAPDPDRLQRAIRKASLHLLKAGIETLKAVEAVITELRSDQPEPPPEPQRIEVE